MAIHGVVGRLALTLIMGLIMWGLSEWATEVFADYRGRINLIDPFVAYDTETAIGAWAIPVLGLLLGFVIRLLYVHQRLWVCASIMLVCGFFFSTIDFVFGCIIEFIAMVGGFQTQNDVPTGDEMALRGIFFAMISGLMLLGLVPGTMFKGSIERNSARRYRKIRKRILKRKAYGS